MGAMKIKLISRNPRVTGGARGTSCIFLFNRALSLFLLLAVAVCFCFPAQAQDRRPAPLASSELGRENLSRVAASAGELKLVLLKDAGLLVELKRWAAKDATDHGQIVSDVDLTNDAIFRRLEEDVQFRSIATQLVQKYGYLVPALNPESELGKERALLVQERVKWLSQHEEKGRKHAHARNEQGLQNTRGCEAAIETDCAAGQPRPGLQTSGSQDLGGEQPPAQRDRDGQNPQTAPRGGSNPLEQAHWMQTGADSDSEFSQFVPRGIADSFVYQNGTSGRTSLDLPQQAGGDGIFEVAELGL